MQLILSTPNLYSPLQLKSPSNKNTSFIKNALHKINAIFTYTQTLTKKRQSPLISEQD